MDSQCWVPAIAADLDKPDGLTVLGPGDLPGPLLNIGPEELPGVGGRMRARLERAGFSTVGDLWNSDPDHTLRVEFLKSDRIDSLDLPQDDGLCRLAESIAKALNSEIRRGVRQACADFLSKYGWVLRSAEASDSRSRRAPSSGPRERLGY